MNVSLIVLGVLFVALKLAGVVSWAWWIVTLPLWVVPVTVAAFLVAAAGASFTLVFVLAFVQGLRDDYKRKRHGS